MFYLVNDFKDVANAQHYTTETKTITPDYKPWNVHNQPQPSVTHTSSQLSQ